MSRRGRGGSSATGLTMVGARYYDEANGRFISVDPVLDLADPQQWNAYAYANNNPTTYSDPSGLTPRIDDDYDGGRGPLAKRPPATSAPPSGLVSALRAVGRDKNGELTAVNMLQSKYAGLGDWAIEMTEGMMRSRAVNIPLPRIGNPNSGNVLYEVEYQIGNWAPDIALMFVGGLGGVRIAARAGMRGALKFLPRRAPIAGSGVRALSALEQGAAKMPSAWGEGVANVKGIGRRWVDPAAPKANGIRIDEGVSGSTWPSQRVDHVVVRSGGRVLGRDGKPIVGRLRDNPGAHIPLSEWLGWSSWNIP